MPLIVLRPLSRYLLASIVAVALIGLSHPAVGAISSPTRSADDVERDHVDPAECDEFSVDDQGALLVNGVPTTDADIDVLADRVLGGYDDRAAILRDALLMVADAQSRLVGDICLDAHFSDSPETSRLDGHFEVCGPVTHKYVQRYGGRASLVTVDEVLIDHSQMTYSSGQLAQPAEAISADACFVMRVAEDVIYTEFSTQLCVSAAATTESSEDVMWHHLALGYLDTVFELEPRDPDAPITDPHSLLSESGGTIVKLDMLAWNDWDWGDSGLRVSVVGPAECPHATPLPAAYSRPSPSPEVGYGATTGPVTGPTPTPRPTLSRSTSTPSPSPSPSPSATPNPNASSTPTPTASPSPSLAAITRTVGTATPEALPSAVLPLFVLAVAAFLG